MAGLESQEEDSPKRILFFKPMSWLGQIRSQRNPSDSGEAARDLWLQESIELTTTITLLTLYHLLPAMDSTSGRIHSEFVRLAFL
jgi:hypothetical protein